MSEVDVASEILNQGGIVIFPTDTAYGIGCKMDNPDAIKRLFEIKKRPLDQAPPVLFDSKERVMEYVKDFDDNVDDLMDEYWPGALTIVLDCYKEKIPEIVRKGETLGARIPDHEVPLGLIKKVNKPILGPSANFNGEKTPYFFKDLDKSLLKLVDFCLEGKTKNKNISSTVVDCTVSPWHIIRQGEVLLDI